MTFKTFISKFWKGIVFVVSIIVSFIAGVITLSLMKDKISEKKKDEIINDNESTLEEINEKEKEHADKIEDSNNNYADLINGSFKRK